MVLVSRNEYCETKIVDSKNDGHFFIQIRQIIALGHGILGSEVAAPKQKEAHTPMTSCYVKRITTPFGTIYWFDLFGNFERAKHVLLTVHFIL